MDQDPGATAEAQIARLEHEIAGAEQQLEQIQRTVRDFAFRGLENSHPWLLGAVAGGVAAAVVVLLISLLGRH